MYPRRDPSLVLSYLANEWARELVQRPSEDAVINHLVSAIWAGELVARKPETTDGRAASRQRKQPRVRHSLELFELGVQLAQKAETETTRCRIDRAVLFRDGLII